MISVITPVYNGERFIESCIKVVIDQNCTDVEHIIVDGGSTDKTVGIIQQYAEKYPHIRWISEQDRGQSDALNKGIQMAKGEILGILNIDDFYEPKVLHLVLELFKTLPEPSFLVGNCYIRDSSGNLIRTNKPAKLRFWDLVKEPFLNPFPCNPSAYFYHTSLHKQVGFYDVEDHYSMDLDFILRAVRVAHVKYVDKFWGNFCEHEDTKTARDKQTGQSQQRVISLIQTYQQYLPWWRKLQLTIKEKYPSIDYFLSRVIVILKKIKVKLVGIIPIFPKEPNQEK